MQKIIYASSIILFFNFTFEKNAPLSYLASGKLNKPAIQRKIVKYGLASYYAKKFNGRKTASGVVFRSGKLTAACNSLPLGSWVKITNLRNKKSIIVEINDRLHHRSKRLIDLSRYGAQKLGFISRGVARVKVEVIPNPIKVNVRSNK